MGEIVTVKGWGAEAENSPRLPHAREERPVFSPAEADAILGLRAKLSHANSRITRSNVDDTGVPCLFRLADGSLAPAVRFRDERARLLFRGDAQRQGDSIEGPLWQHGDLEAHLFVAGHAPKEIHGVKVSGFGPSWKNVVRNMEGVELSSRPRVTALKDILASELELFKHRAEIFSLQVNYRNEQPPRLPLVAVHATDHFPADGLVAAGGNSRQMVNRATVHFTLNGIAAASGWYITDKWEHKKFYVVTPLSDLITANNPIGMIPADTFFPSPVRLPARSFVLTSWQDAKELISPVSAVFPIDRAYWRGWSPSVHPCDVLGVYHGFHSDHWTGRYEEMRGKGIDHDAAIGALFGHLIDRWKEEGSTGLLNDLRLDLRELNYLTPEVEAMLSAR